jgi:hypothetical protein
MHAWCFNSSTPVSQHHQQGWERNVWLPRHRPLGTMDVACMRMVRGSFPFLLAGDISCLAPKNCFFTKYTSQVAGEQIPRRNFFGCKPWNVAEFSGFIIFWHGSVVSVNFSVGWKHEYKFWSIYSQVVIFGASTDVSLARTTNHDGTEQNWIVFDLVLEQ